MWPGCKGLPRTVHAGLLDQRQQRGLRSHRGLGGGARSGAEPRPSRTGRATRVGPLNVAGLGGTFAPTWFETPAAALPHKASDDKRRHFVREEVEACKRLRGIDILMTHEAARPFIIVDDVKQGSEGGGKGAAPRRRDAGKPAINDVLATMQPRLHLCGHHHRFVETVREGVPSVCIDRINRSQLVDRGVDVELSESRPVGRPPPVPPGDQ